jgi:hypothetical protein
MVVIVALLILCSPGFFFSTFILAAVLMFVGDLALALRVQCYYTGG